MKILSWNVNGIRAVLKKGFLDVIKKQNPDIFCLQEIKASLDKIPDELKNIKGYNVYFFPAKRPGYSGTAIYSKLTAKKITYGFSKKFDDEGRSISLEFDKYILFNVYFPNGKASDIRLKYKLDFYTTFLKYISKQKKPVIFCGDINTAHKEIDLANPKANKKFSGFLDIERKWIDKVIDKGYIDSFREFDKEKDKYTWWSQRFGVRERNVGWRIDYFFIDKKLQKYLKKSYILSKIMGSDHCPIGIDINIK